MADTKHPADVFGDADALTLAAHLAADYAWLRDEYGLYIASMLGAQSELRRIPALEAERDAMQQSLYDEIDANFSLRDLGGALPDEDMGTFLRRVIAERDQLRAERDQTKELLVAEDDERLRYETDAEHARLECDQLRAEVEALKRRAALDELARIDQDIAAAPKPCRCGPDGCADSACPGRDINRHQIAFDRRMAAITTKPEDRT